MWREGECARGDEGGRKDVIATRTRRGVAAWVILCAALVVVGCSPPAKGAAPAPDVVGQWEIGSAMGKAASVSEIGFAGDGTFKHAGHDALGKPVTFQGVYAVGESEQGPVIQLTYDDFPERPTRWFFRVDGDELRVAPMPEDLDTENALEFERAQQQ